MATFKNHYSEFKNETVANRVQKMVEIKKQLIADGVENLHVKLSFGNRKTGALVPSVSTIPVHDCGNCKVCKNGCYDVRNVCFQGTVQKQRANNSAILWIDPERYFAEIEKACKGLRFFRWHVGGDMLNRSYFLHVLAIAESCKHCDFLIFTKLYGVVNSYLRDGGVIPENLHIVFSDWRGAEFENPYNMPVSSPVWFDDFGEEIERGPHTTKDFVWCPGDCSECAVNGAGCFGLKKGQTVLFQAH